MSIEHSIQPFTLLAAAHKSEFSKLNENTIAVEMLTLKRRAPDIFVWNANSLIGRYLSIWREHSYIHSSFTWNGLIVERGVFSIKSNFVDGIYSRLFTLLLSLGHRMTFSIYLSAMLKAF